MDFNKKLKVSGNKQRISSWWSRNGYKIFRVVLFPLYLVYLISEWVKKKKCLKQKEKPFDKNRAKKILDRWLPDRFAFVLRHMDVKEGENESILITDWSDIGDISLRASGIGWIRGRKDQKYCFAHWKQFVEYVLNEYEIKGWESKRIRGWTEWNRVCEEFGWHRIYGNEKDHMTGVVFFRERKEK